MSDVNVVDRYTASARAFSRDMSEVCTPSTTCPFSSFSITGFMWMKGCWADGVLTGTNSAAATRATSRRPTHGGMTDHYEPPW